MGAARDRGRPAAGASGRLAPGLRQAARWSGGPLGPRGRASSAVPRPSGACWGGGGGWAARGDRGWLGSVWGSRPACYMRERGAGGRARWGRWGDAAAREGQELRAALHARAISDGSGRAGAARAQGCDCRKRTVTRAGEGSAPPGPAAAPALGAARGQARPLLVRCCCILRRASSQVRGPGLARRLLLACRPQRPPLPARCIAAAPRSSATGRNGRRGGRQLARRCSRSISQGSSGQRWRSRRRGRPSATNGAAPGRSGRAAAQPGGAAIPGAVPTGRGQQSPRPARAQRPRRAAPRPQLAADAAQGCRRAGAPRRPGWAPGARAGRPRLGARQAGGSAAAGAPRQPRRQQPAVRRAGNAPRGPSRHARAAAEQSGGPSPAAARPWLALDAPRACHRPRAQARHGTCAAGPASGAAAPAPHLIAPHSSVHHPGSGPGAAPGRTGALASR
jgi:hypothetical protein